MAIYTEEIILIKDLKDGRKEAYEFLFKKYYSALCHYANKYLKNDHTSEDVVSQLFCTLYLRRDEIVVGSLAPYLFRAVRNSAINYLRDNRQLLSLDTINNVSGPGDYQFEVQEEISGSLMAQEVEDVVNKALEALPEQCRAVFMLSRFESLTYRQIAEKLGISVNTVETQMSRALKKLRSALGSYLTLFLFLIHSGIHY